MTGQACPPWMGGLWRRSHGCSVTRVTLFIVVRGYSASTIDVYARAVRRLTDYFDCVPDQLSIERGKLLHEIAKAGLKLPADIAKKWVVDCRHTGRGESALEYLSRYLYRGVISESNIVANQHGKVTFRYTDGKNKETRTEILSGEDSIWRVIQHVLRAAFIA